MDWFLYDRDFRHERVKTYFHKNALSIDWFLYDRDHHHGRANITYKSKRTYHLGNMEHDFFFALFIPNDSVYADQLSYSLLGKH